MVKDEEKTLKVTATQSGSKQITLTSTQDIQAKTISVKKGTSDVKIAKSEFTTDGKTALLTLEANVVAAEYTITIGENEATASFTGELSKLTSIDFTSDYAIVDGEFGTATTAYTYYVAKNQWDEDVTTTTSLVANSSAPTTTAAKGKITFTYTTALTAASLNDPLTVVVYDSTTAVTSQKTLKISNKALVATIEPYGTDGIYNANGKSLAVADKYTESFYYLFRAQDQYGNYLTDASKMTQSNGFYRSYSAGLTNLGASGTLTTKEVDGVTYFAIPLILGNDLQPGTATLILVAGGSGKSVNAQIKVNDGNTVDTITVTAPTTVAYGDNDVKFDYTAQDSEGNSVTSYAQLSKLTISPAGSPSTYGFYWSKVNGKAVLCFNTSRTGSTLTNPATSLGEVVTATFLTTTYKSSMVTFNVKQQRYPAEIIGLADGVANAQLIGRNIELNVGDFKVVDQYGDSFDLKNKPYGIIAELVLGSAFTADGSNGSPAYYKQSSATGITGGAYSSNDLAIAQSADASATSFNLKAAATGESTYEFKLVARNTTSNAYEDLKNTIDATTKNISELGSKKITLMATSNSKFVRYEVESPKLLYVTNDKNFDGTANDFGTPSDFEPSIKVFGIDNTGAKVKLTTTDYQISGGTNVNADASGKLSAAITSEASYNKDFALKDSTLAGNFKVTMNDGTIEVIDITLSNSAPSVASLELINGQTYLAPAVAIDADYILENVKGKDNYGFDVKWDTAGSKLAFYGNGSSALTAPSITPTLTVSDFVYAGSTVPNNGTANPTFTGIVSGDKFTVSIVAGAATLAIPVVPEMSAYQAMANDTAKAITDAMTGANVSIANDNVTDADTWANALAAKHATAGYTVTITWTTAPTSFSANDTAKYKVTIKNQSNNGTSTSVELTSTLQS